jgi:hypothetical protein
MKLGYESRIGKMQHEFELLKQTLGKFIQEDPHIH